MEKIQRFIDIKAGLQEVWELISSQEGMRQWISTDMEIDARVGGKYRVKNPEENQMICGEVLEILPMESISLSWFELGSDWMNPTKVTFRLEEIANGIRVHVTHTGFERIRKRGWEKTYNEYQKGWTRHHLLENLKARAEA
ncbi:SRPBCC family protein [Pseudalkalibacillus caeni]|nr:SRPBCC domain-containing protein [Pseudalkalibacillus caeni]